MVRSKVKIAYIPNDTARRATYRKRSKSLLNKTRELSTLCDVQACSIVYGPYSRTPEVCPSVEVAQEVLTRYRNMPEYQQGAKKANLESFTNERIRKEEDKLAKLQKMNYRNDMTRVMYKRMRGEETSKACLDDLLEMGSISDEKMMKIVDRLEKIRLEAKGVESEMVNGTLGGNPSHGVETLTVSGEGENPQRVEIGNGVDEDNILPEVEDLTHCYEGLADELVALYKDFNWEENAAVIPSTDDGNSVNPNDP